MFTQGRCARRRAERPSRCEKHDCSTPCPVRDAVISDCVAPQFYTSILSTCEFSTQIHFPRVHRTGGRACTLRIARLHVSKHSHAFVIVVRTVIDAVSRHPLCLHNFRCFDTAALVMHDNEDVRLNGVKSVPGKSVTLTVSAPLPHMLSRALASSCRLNNLMALNVFVADGVALARALF